MFALGQGSYVGIAQQAGPTGWGGALVATGLKTFPNLGGDVLSPVAGNAARRSIVTPMPRASQIYKTVDLVECQFNFEVVTDPTAFKPLLLAALGKRVRSGITPDFVDTYTVVSPKFDFAADLDPTFYDHTLSFHAFLSPDGTSIAGSRFSVKDLIVTQFEWSGENNAATVMTFQGTGRTLAASASTVIFADQAGSLLSWDRAASATPAGLYMDVANPPTTAWKVRTFRFVLAQPHTFETGLGAAAGAEMFTPFRTNPPTAQLSWETFYEDVAGTDPAQNMVDFIARTAQGVIINYRVSVQNYVKLAAHGAVDPGFLNNPKIGWGPNGAVSFGAQLDIFPDATADLFLELGSSSGT